MTPDFPLASNRHTAKLVDDPAVVFGTVYIDSRSILLVASSIMHAKDSASELTTLQIINSM